MKNTKYTTENKGLLKYDIQRDKYTHYPGDIYEKNGLLDGRIIDIEQDDYGDLWIGTKPV